MKNSPFILSASLLLAAAAAVGLLGRRGEPVVVATNLERLPYEIAGFRGTDDSFGPAVYRELNA
ncbi:MAG: hypothetical protein M0017_12685, partial [Desulfobacteraceae bacterium]|nr:hypothetical protein [Desulfobacteraceae bacterium]